MYGFLNALISIPQPNFVPVNPMMSRITHSNGVDGLVSTGYCLLLTEIFNMMLFLGKPKIRSEISIHAEKGLK